MELQPVFRCDIAGRGQSALEEAVATILRGLVGEGGLRLVVDVVDDALEYFFQCVGNFIPTEWACITAVRS